ncbi:39S ribosomal protein L37, mitochondrial-like isoform X1 [Argonauta hians]
MRLTVVLCALHRGPLIKKLWKHRGKFAEPQTIIPKCLVDSGVEIVDPTVKPVPTQWKPPVKDDPRWWEPPPLEEQPNYHVDPIYFCYRNCRLMEGLKQAQILTKTQTFKGFPPDLKNRIGEVVIPNQDELVQRNIMFSQVWHSNYKRLPKRIDTSKPGFKFTREYGIPPLQASNLLLSNLLRLCQTQTKLYPEILTDYQMMKSTFLRTHLTYDNRLIQITGENAALLLSKKPLPNFGSEDIVDASTTFTLPDMYPVSPLIDIPKLHIYKTEESSGFHNNAAAQLPALHPHTLFMTHHNYWHNDQNCALGLLYCAGYAINEARRRFGMNVQTLPEPINVQCVSMNYNTFNFLFFQLNTLNFQSSEGVKNLLWCDAKNVMFHKELRKPWLGRAHRTNKYRDYDSTVFPKFLAVYLSGRTSSV